MDVSRQAVSKWENGKNMPDTALIKEMCQDFNISLEELFEGELKEEKKINKSKNLYSIIIIILILLLILITILFIIFVLKGGFEIL